MWDDPQTAFVEPPAYRIILVRADGSVAGVRPIDARDDAEAMVFARNASGIHTVELWDGLLFVEHFPPRVGA